MRAFLAKMALSNKKGLKDKIEEYTRTDFFTKEQIADYQNKKLGKLVKHAYENVPYYTKVFNL